MTIREIAGRMKQISPVMAASDQKVRNGALAAVRDALLAHKEEIFAANARDMEAAQQYGVPAAVRKRLIFDDGKLGDVCAGLDQLIGLDDPLG